MILLYSVLVILVMVVMAYTTRNFLFKTLPISNVLKTILNFIIIYGSISMFVTIYIFLSLLFTFIL